MLINPKYYKDLSLLEFTLTRLTASTLCLISLIFIGSQACSPKNTSEPAPAPPQTSKDKSSTETRQTLDADTYTVSLPQSDTPLTINPKPGYKINADFPHRAILTAGEITETALTDHNEKRLLFKLPKETKLPNVGIKADLSFSVCNDQMCKLYKETYQW